MPVDLVWRGFREGMTEWRDERDERLRKMKIQMMTIAKIPTPNPNPKLKIPPNLSIPLKHPSPSSQNAYFLTPVTSQRRIPRSFVTLAMGAPSTTISILCGSAIDKNVWALPDSGSRIGVRRIFATWGFGKEIRDEIFDEFS